MPQQAIPDSCCIPDYVPQQVITDLCCIPDYVPQQAIPDLCSIPELYVTTSHSRFMCHNNLF